MSGIFESLLDGDYQGLTFTVQYLIDQICVYYISIWGYKYLGRYIFDMLPQDYKDGLIYAKEQNIDGSVKAILYFETFNNDRRYWKNYSIFLISRILQIELNLEKWDTLHTWLKLKRLLRFISRFRITLLDIEIETLKCLSPKLGNIDMFNMSSYKDGNNR